MLARRETSLSPPVKHFNDRSKAVLLLWIIYVISVLFLLCFCARLFINALWSAAGKGLTSWLSFVMSNCLFVCFVALRPKSTAMVIAGRSVHLTTLFPGQA